MTNQPASRRTFVKTAVAASAVFAVPNIVGAQDKAEAKPLILGQGRHTYEWRRGWGQLPEGKKYGDCHMVQETADGRIVIHHNGSESIAIFDPEGKYIGGWGKEYAGAAHGMQLRKEGNEEFLYLAPTGQNRIVKTNLKGEIVWEIGYPAQARNAKGEPCYNGPKRYVPTNIAFAPNGDFYVADGYGSNYIHQYRKNGDYVRTWGGGGKEEGQMSCPHGIWVDTRDPANPLVLVADRSNVRLQWFTLEGKFVKLVTREGDKLRHPCHFDQREGDLLIPDLHGRVTILDKDNQLVTHLGDNEVAGNRGQHGLAPDKRVPGQFVTPHGACWDRAGNIFVTEWITGGRVTKLRKV